LGFVQPLLGLRFGESELGHDLLGELLGPGCLLFRFIISLLL
jgi:hypothetical protein